MFFMCFFKDPPSNVPVNWLVKWVVFKSPLEWNYKIFLKISTSKIQKNTKILLYLKLSLNSAMKRASEQVCFLLSAQVLTFRL